MMIGARAHYTVPLQLMQLGALGRLYTDAWAGPLLRRIRSGPSLLRGLSGRYHPALPNNKVTAFTLNAIHRRLVMRRPLTIEEQYLGFIDDGRAFSQRVNQHLERKWKQIQPAGVLGYDTSCLETQQLMADRGLPSIVDQIDPARVEERIVRAEADKWPGWQAIPGGIPEPYFKRLEHEWQLATHIVVNSEWSRDALVQQGVPKEKLVVIPLCYEAPVELNRTHGIGSEPTLTVLWLGLVILRKGIQYLVEAARLLYGRRIRFIVAGPIGISRQAIASAPDNMQFVGTISRTGVGELYRTADLFVLPTLSDGFAITQIEAMAHGLPVIATPNCGEVVSDGEDGRIVPAGNPSALAAAIDDLASNREKLVEMSRKAALTVRRFSVEESMKRLRQLIVSTHAVA